MTARRFVFNPYLYRVSNQETWRRMRKMDGTTVTVLGPPDENNLNTVQGFLPDGLQITFRVFNSELEPVT